MVPTLITHWNTLELPQPPQTSITLHKKSGVNITSFKDEITHLTSLIKRVNLEYAGALCSRLIYKCKLKFRGTKWLGLIEKINGALFKVLRMKLTPTLKSILDSTCTTENQLPSRAMLEWLLIKLQGFARLLVRLVITSHRVGFMFRQCLAIGHNWHIIVVLMSLASQIWTNCQLLLKQTFKSYRLIHQTMQGSLLNQKPWSSSPVPEDLAIWIAEEIAVLGCNAADVFRINLPHIKSPSRDEEYLGDENEPLSDEDDVDLASVNDWEDMGEIISRDDLFTKPSIKSIDESNTEEGVTPSDNIEDEEEVDVDKNIDEITPTCRTKKEKRSKKKKRLKRKNKRESPAEDEEINNIVIRDVIHDSNGIMSKKKRKKIKSVDSNQIKLKKDISKDTIAEELIKTNGELRKSKKSTKKEEKRKLKDLMFNKPTNSLVVENESDSPNENTLNQKAKSLVANNDTSSVFVNHNQTKSKTNSKLKRKLATFDPDQCDSIDIKKKKAKTKPLFKSSKTDSAKLKKQKDVKPKKVINMTNMFNVELIK